MDPDHPLAGSTTTPHEDSAGDQVIKLNAAGHIEHRTPKRGKRGDSSQVVEGEPGMPADDRLLARGVAARQPPVSDRGDRFATPRVRARSSAMSAWIAA